MAVKKKQKKGARRNAALKAKFKRARVRASKNKKRKFS